MLACVCIGIVALAVRTVQVQVLDGAALARAAESSSASRYRCGRRAGRSSTAPGRRSRSPSAPSPWASGPRASAIARRFAQALSRYTRITPAVIEQRMGGSAQYVFVARQLDPSTWSRIKADATLGPLVKSRAIESEQEPRRVYPNGGLAAQVVGIDGDGLSGVEMSRNDVLSARDGLASVSKVNDRPMGDAHWARVLHVREPVPGKQVQLTLDCASSGWCSRRSHRPASSGRPRRSRRSCSIRAPAASSRWPRCPASRRPATAPAIPRSGACARSPTSTSRARRSSS